MIYFIDFSECTILLNNLFFETWYSINNKLWTSYGTNISYTSTEMIVVLIWIAYKAIPTKCFLVELGHSQLERRYVVGRAEPRREHRRLPTNASRRGAGCQIWGGSATRADVWPGREKGGVRTSDESRVYSWWYVHVGIGNVYSHNVQFSIIINPSYRHWIYMCIENKHIFILSRYIKTDYACTK